MPYKDPEKKKEWQRKYMAEYMRGYRKRQKEKPKAPENPSSDKEWLDFKKVKRKKKFGVF